MLKISDAAKAFIQSNFDNPNELLSAEHVNDILDPLYDLIDEKGFAGEEYNDFGRAAQRIYDELYDNN